MACKAQRHQEATFWPSTLRKGRGGVGALWLDQDKVVSFPQAKLAQLQVAYHQLFQEYDSHIKSSMVSSEAEPVSIGEVSSGCWGLSCPWLLSLQFGADPTP